MKHDDPEYLHLVPPQNLEAEQAVLGSMMLESYAIEKAQELLASDDFYRDAHTVLFATMVGMAGRNEPVDLTTISEDLTRSKLLETVGGLPYLVSLLHAVPSPANIEHYARIVLKKSTRRKVIAAADQIKTLAYHDDDCEPDVLADRAAETLQGIGAETSSKGLLHIGPAAVARLEELSELSKSDEETPGIPTGIRRFDFMTGGLKRRHLYILAADTSMGKTSFALGVALNAARDNRGTIAVFSLEMSREEVVDRYCSMLTGVDLKAFDMPRLWRDDRWDEMSRGVGELQQIPLYVSDDSQPTVARIRSRSRKLAREQKGLGLIVVDYTNLVRGRDREDEQEKLRQAVEGMRSLARELNVPVLALTQLNRNLWSREDKRPILSDIYASSFIGYTADVVFFLYRPSYYARKSTVNQDGESPDDAAVETDAEIIVAKQRNGPKGNVPVAFTPKNAMYGDIDQWHENHR